MTPTDLKDIIAQHSDYNMHNPYWIDLSSHEDLSEEDRKKLSHYLNEYFKENGPDVCDDFNSVSSCLMKRETAELAVKYAFEKAGLDYISEVIDGLGSLETDGREDDPVTGELLHGYPIHDRSIIEDLEYLFEQDKLSKDDWRYLDMVCDGLFSLAWKRTDEKVKVLLEKVVMKFHALKIRNPFKDEIGLYFLLDGKEELEAVFNALSCARHDASFNSAEKIKETMRRIQLDMCEALEEDPEDYK